MSNSPKLKALAPSAGTRLSAKDSRLRSEYAGPPPARPSILRNRRPLLSSIIGTGTPKAKH